MARERIDIVITENGSRVVKRNIEAIGGAAKGSASAVDFLKKALAGLGSALAARELARALDNYTNIQNKLKAVGLEGQNLTAVYKELLSISNETTSSIEGSVTIYSRLAQASKELGASQRELLDFTKSLNQAVILSGASAEEAKAAMIQLSQGMASGTLRGDELRSVLEQLPIVADVIADHLGVTRGELRQMGQDGEITATKILDAFKEARVELAERFATRTVTIGAAFQVLKNNVLDALGEMDKRIGITAAASSAILLVANNLDTVTAALTDLSKVLITTGAAYAAFIVSLKVESIVNAATAWLAYRQAIASGTVVVLGSAEAERQRAVATLESAAASEAAAVTALSEAAAEEAAATARLAGTRSVLALMAAERELEVVRLQAQISAIGRMQSLNRLAEVRRAELALTQTIAREEAALATAQAASAAAEATRAAALANLTKAQAGVTAATAAAAGTTSLLGQAVNTLKGYLLALWAVIVANPITAIIVALTAATTALVVWRDQIKLGVDDITTLGDLMRAAGEKISAAWDSLKDKAKALFSTLSDLLPDWVLNINITLNDILIAVAKAVDTYLGLWKGAYKATIVLFKGLPAAIADVFKSALNKALKEVQDFINDIGALSNAVNRAVGLPELFKPIDLQITNEQKGSAKQLGKDVATAFQEGFNETNPVQGFLKELTARAQEIARARQPAAQGGEIEDGPRIPKPPKVDQKELDALIGKYDQVWKAQKEFTDGVKLLDQALAAGQITLERRNELVAIMSAQLRDAMDPMAALDRELTRETEYLKLNSDNREVAIQLRQIEQDMLQQGLILTEQELSQIRERLQLLQQETREAQARDAVYQQVIGTQREFKEQLEAINALIAAGVITRQQGISVLVQQEQDLFKGTIEAQQAQIQAAQDMYAKIDQMRQADLISEQTAAQMKAKVDAQLQQAKLENTLNLLGTLKELMSSSNKKLFAIGKAAAIAEATIKGALAVQTALTSAPPPWNFAQAAAVGIVAAANVAKIAAQEPPAFAFGGDMRVGGVGGTDSQMVAFRATPGERVSISTPQQDRDRAKADERMGKGEKSEPPVIANFIDPGLFRAYLDSNSGREVLRNVIREESGSINQALASG